MSGPYSAPQHRRNVRYRHFVQVPLSLLTSLTTLKATGSVHQLILFLASKCFGFGKGYADFTYRQLSNTLGCSPRSIAAASKILRDKQLVHTETLPDGSFRWSIPVLAQEIVEDPLALQPVKGVPPHELLHEEPHPRSIRGMQKSVLSSHPSQISKNPYAIRPPAGPKEAPKTPPKRHDLETYEKRHHQEHNDDDACGQKIHEELVAVGMKPGVARKLLSTHQHDLITSALESAKLRPGIQNPAGYILNEVKQGGFAPMPQSVKPSSSVSQGTRFRPNPSPIVHKTVQQTREEMAALEAEKRRKDQEWQRQGKALAQRFQQLSQDIQLKLKTCWTRHTETLVPNIANKAIVLQQNPAFQKTAFKEVAGKFFELLDQGLAPDQALIQLAA